MGLSAASKRTLLANTYPATYGKEVQRVKKTGSFRGKSNKLGYGGRSAQLKAMGVPGGVIGALARKAQAAPGQKNYHGKRKG
jgi:hypothetical protein